MKYLAKLDGEEREFVLERQGERLLARSGDKVYAIDVSLVGDGATFSMLVDGRSYDVVADVDRQSVVVQLLGQRFAGNKQGGKQELRASMPGIVIDIKVAVGDVVEEGKTLVVLEAMKMQNPLGAETAGKVVRILCKKGEAVAAGALLLELE
jgi:biotin carboxyl carrier protein